MDTYELIFITENDTDETLKKVSSIVEKYNGVVKEKKSWGKKKFSYRIKKHLYGFYFEWIIEMPKKYILDFKKQFSQTELVLRYLLLIHSS